MRGLSGRSHVVTGAGSGIGRAVALRLAQEGAAVTLVGRRAGPLAEVAAAIERAAGRCAVHAGDLLEDATAEQACRLAVATFGRLDGFVHAAGDAVRGSPLESTTDSDWERMLAVHAGALRRLVAAAAPRMRAGGGGSVVAIASNLAQVAIPGLAAYAAAKGAVASLTRALAVELGPEAIRVNSICPGLIETEATRAAEGFAANRDGYARRAPLRRIGSAEEVAAAAAYLLSEDASFVTGHALVVDGGYAIA